MASEAAHSVIEAEPQPQDAAATLGSGPPEPSATPDPLVCPQCGGVKTASARRCARCARGGSSRGTAVRLEAPPSLPRGTNAFRVYCVMCGRSSEVPAALARVGRCPVCGGTQLTEDLS